MISFLKREPANEEVIQSVLDKLKVIYKNKLLPLEEYFHFHECQSPKLEDADFDAKPMILLIGQYSTGKTTFLRYLLEQDFPGMRIGPEPTTDRFIVVMHDEKEDVIPGNALTADPTKQFRPLRDHGSTFLNHLQCSTVNSQILKAMTIVDTPGVFSGEQDRIDRGYDFTTVLTWFAERVDRIILFFDAFKLDISDEFRRSIEALRGHDDKIRIVLNKADMMSPQQLMRSYGAFMWFLGKVLQVPEAVRVYIGSFWNEKRMFTTNQKLFEAEERDLFKDLQSLPRNAALRKLNDLMKRAQLAKVQAHIIAELHKDMPSMFGKESKKKELIKNLDQIYKRIQREHGISPRDFPEIHRMQEALLQLDFTKFHSLKRDMLEYVDESLGQECAILMKIITQNEMSIHLDAVEKGGIFEGVLDSSTTPFSYKRGEGIDAGFGDHEWICLKDKTRTDEIFNKLGPIDGKLSGSAAKQELVQSKLPNSVLSKVWKLSDIDRDGYLDCDEFAVAVHLVKIKTEGYELPHVLPHHLVPPSKRT